ncbi:beta-ketoacyl-acyl-carrier-protein synthase II [Sphaceloma murrayae]|uniref:Beta-ketoacyl-acyl-carrier-protein synthase II n=1 Tax=Sphaceloma murrayae TaxID=2082308 RepID=A0A2K1R2Q7_9PEZI|nr:beta-ketoacyl-acyl-carrier-protein synthase II [Sphaceloma murrayae]
MAGPTRVYVFGDQTFDIADLLTKLLHTYDDPVLTDFIERSTAALKREVARLGRDKQQDCPPFATLVDLIPRWRTSTLNPALCQALTCICQIAAFMREHGAQGQTYPLAKDTCLSGLCTGSLSAVAASCAKSASDLLTLGVQTIKIAFRVGACAWDFGLRLSASRDEAGRYQSWTAALAGVTYDEVAAIVKEFAAERSLAKTTSPYVSARIAASAVSVSAAPRIINSLLSDTPLGKRVVSRLTITAPYHAGHLYTEENVDAILADLKATETHISWPSLSLPIVSSVTGEVIPTASFPDALRVVVNDCLRNTIRWDLTPAAVAAYIKSTSPTGSFSIHSIATNADSLRPTIQKILGSSNGLTSTITPASIDQQSVGITGPAAKSKLAIVGMSGRFPRARSMNGFWNVLVNGVDCHELVPAARWPADLHVDNVANPAKNVSGTGFGCWLHDAAEFDARYFNMSPREAPQVDPAQRMALLTATEALEQAGIVPNRTASTEKTRVGVYFGSTSNDWMETNSAQDIDTYFIPGGNRAFIPGRINYHFKFSGPSYTIDTACSSSLAALHLACNALWKGEIDTAIVGGTNVLTNPDMTAGLDRGHFLSRTGNCKTFDEGADGYCRGEAVSTAILKRLDDALADRDPVKACILAISTNHNADAESITRPHVGAQRELFEKVLGQAGINPANISYCELHGTGTQAGDAGETASVINTLAPLDGPYARKESQPLYVGAAKANIGHGEAAAGVTSLAKVVLMLEKNTIPPHCGIKTKINSKIPELSSRNTFIANKPVPWPRPKGGVRQVMLNNFSAAGGNTAMILEDAPEIEYPSIPDARGSHVVAVSAKTPFSLEENIKNLIDYIDNEPSDDLTLPRLSYTTTARRIHHPHRVVAVGTTLAEIRKSLQTSLDTKEGSTRSKTAPNYVFSFTGQGAQFNGMGADYYSRLSDFRADINQYDQICRQLELPSIKALFSDPEAFKDATPTMLQLAAVCLQMALFRFWVSLGVQPKAVVGHSLGEYSALYAAGVLSQADVLSLVGRRAELLETHCEEGSHAMLAIRTSALGLTSLLGEPGKDYEISCVNGKESIVLGGTKEQMNNIRPKLGRKLSHTFLEVPYAYHTAQVEPILSSLDSIARGIKFNDPAIPVISPAVGKVIHKAEDFPQDFISRHCRGTVNMHDALTVAKSEGLLDEKMMGIEIGPAPVVVKMVKEVAGPGFQTFSSMRQGDDSWKHLTQALGKFHAAGAALDWNVYNKDFESAQQVLQLPAYGWNYQSYWMQYVNAWSLRKGDPPLRIVSGGLDSSSIQKVIKDELSKDGGELIVESDLIRPDLHPMVQGHHVYGVPLCTPSVYADISMTIGEHVKNILGGQNLGVEVSKMTIQSALVANEEGRPQILRTVGKINHKDKSVHITFHSVNKDGKATEQHSNTVVRLYDIEKVKKAALAKVPEVKNRIKTLKDQTNSTGSTFRFSKAMIYKMIGKLADFDPNYRGLSEITLDNDNMEATGFVTFKNVMNEGKYHTNPAFIDALSQLGGFVMNANEGVDLDKELFVNHGWENFQLFEPISPTMNYFSHVKMAEGADKLWSGDVFIFDEADKLVAIFTGVQLQGVPKRLMEIIVQGAKKRLTNLLGPAPAGSAKPAAATKATPKPGAHAPAPKVAATHTSAKTVTKTVAVAPKTSGESPAVVTAMDIISEESGIALAELTDDSRFDDIGVDSLLSLMVSSRIRDDLGIDLDSAVFMEVSTVGNFKTHLRGLSGHVETETVTETVVEEVSVPAAAAAIPMPAPVAQAANNEAWNSVLAIISEESGLGIDDLTADSSFSDIGIDSLLSLVICSRFRDELEIDIPDQALFMDYTTVEALKNHIIGVGSPSDTDVSTPAGDSSPVLSASSSVSDMRDLTPITPATEWSDNESTRDGFFDKKPSLKKQVSFEVIEQAAPVKPAWSIILQGSPKRCPNKFFLFPDGCGAATSYIKIPRVSDDTAVIGFNSPYMKNPWEMNNHSLSEVVASYVAGVRKHQEHGPYHLGGWSAGGILAYAVGQALMAEGEEIATLTLIDAPAPADGLDRLPKRFFDHCTSVGIFGSEVINDGKGAPPKVPEWLMPHFEATIELLHDYKAPPIPANKRIPDVNIIWAGDCAFDGEKYALLPGATDDDEDTEGMKFLTEKRTDLGPGRWDDLFHGKKLNCEVAEGEHHFSMMRGKGAEQLRDFIKRSIGV